jgi:hypothetical protein
MIDLSLQSPGALNTSFGSPGRPFVAPKLRQNLRKSIAQTAQAYVAARNDNIARNRPGSEPAPLHAMQE